MARKKNAAKEETSPVAEDFAKDEPLHQPKEEAPAEKPRTIDMVRAAIAAGHATAKFGLPWIKEKFGVEMKSGNFSVTKSTIERGNKKAGEHKTVQRQSRAPRQRTEAPVQAAPARTNGQMSPSEAARSVKDLIDKLGVKEVKNLVELFGG
jgi:hypothetical protein